MNGLKIILNCINWGKEMRPGLHAGIDKVLNKLSKQAGEKHRKRKRKMEIIRDITIGNIQPGSTESILKGVTTPSEDTSPL